MRPPPLGPAAAILLGVVLVAVLLAEVAHARMPSAEEALGALAVAALGGANVAVLAGAVRRGELHIRYWRVSRDESPVSFWASCVAVAAAGALWLGVAATFVLPSLW